MDKTNRAIKITRRMTEIEELELELDQLGERVCRLEVLLDVGISVKRELVTLLSCNDHEVARWKDKAWA